METIQLSALVVAYNEEARLAACLDGLTFADETVVVLDKCTDGSKSIASGYTDRLIEGSWDREGERRNVGIEACRGKWIFEIDADERASDVLAEEIRRYDEAARRPRRDHDDDQLRRIAHLRRYRGDRLRTCKFASIDDPRAHPLIAIREQIITRKSLGGIQTDLQSRVLDTSGKPIAGLFAVGEAAGFGGGGVHGKRSLEGTFLGGCVLTARAAAAAICVG